MAVAPYHHGEGTKFRVLEALACGVAVVSTPVGCQGIDVTHGKHLLVAENEAEFARQVIELLRDSLRAQALAAAGRALVETSYTWSHLVADLDPKLEALIRRKRYPPPERSTSQKPQRCVGTDGSPRA